MVPPAVMGVQTYSDLTTEDEEHRQFITKELEQTKARNVDK
jgi:hypothetical protein